MGPSHSRIKNLRFNTAHSTPKSGYFHSDRYIIYLKNKGHPVVSERSTFVHRRRRLVATGKREDGVVLLTYNDSAPGQAYYWRAVPID